MRRKQKQSRYATVPSVSLPRSVFDRSRGHKTTFDAGLLIPVVVDEVLPGDTMSLQFNLFARLATPIYPLMDTLHLDVFFFSVPKRLLWENWEKFNGQQDNPGDSVDYLVPEIYPTTGNDHEQHSLADYFGIPTQVNDIAANAWWHRGYNLIYNEWFRSEDLTDSAVINRDDGPDVVTDYPVQRRCKRPDYFVSALPFPQKGDAVEISLGASAPVLLDTGQTPTVIPDTGDRSPRFKRFVGGGAGEYLESVDATTNPHIQLSGSGFAADDQLAWSSSGLEVDLDGVTGITDLSAAEPITINALRTAVTLQQYAERDARGGTRYTEKIRTHFGVTSPDQRLQRPEYLGGGSTTVSINPVAQTSSTDATTPQGNLAAFGTATGGGMGFNKSFTEHAIIIGLVCLRADITYQQGLPRMFSRRTVHDHYWPSFANLGEQAILNKEIYMDGSSADDDVFGYIPRWDEYRGAQSMVTGLFRSVATTSLDPWHTAQEFGSLPLLATTFIEENPPMDRITAVTNEPDILWDCWASVKHARAMPAQSRPGVERL